MDEERLEGQVRAVRRICEGILAHGGWWSADAGTLAKALLAITRDAERVEMYPVRSIPCKTE